MLILHLLTQKLAVMLKVSKATSAFCTFSKNRVLQVIKKEMYINELYPRVMVILLAMIKILVLLTRRRLMWFVVTK